jgi:hypothetical protein
MECCREQQTIPLRAHRIGKQILSLIPLSNVYSKNAQEYNPDFYNIQDNTYLRGYFESGKFFSNIKDKINEFFIFGGQFNNHPLLSRMKSEQSVSIHIRRTDKANNDGFFLPTDIGYLKTATQILKSKINDPIFYVFSDDIEWCKDNLPHLLDEHMNFIDDQPGDAGMYKDMFLMSQCKHNIIGPSTFSWWGAWLNANPEKIIIAPHKKLWYRDPPDQFDLIPDEWLVLE